MRAQSRAKMKKSTEGIICVDMGGTKLRVAAIDTEGSIKYRNQWLTKADRDVDSVIDKLEFGIESALNKASPSFDKIDTIALAVAGAIDIKKGLITSSPNLPGWKNVPIVDIIQSKFHLRTLVVNDASAAAYGEFKLGVGKGINNLVYLTVSTGIGGGIIIDGDLYEGTDGSAGEIGHMIIKEGGPLCHCGQNGCLETMASGYAITREFIANVKQQKKTYSNRLIEGKMSSLTAKDVAEAARTGDKLAIEAINQASYFLGVGMANIINIFNPEIIVIGGGLSKMGDMFLKPASETAKKIAMKLPAKSVRIRRAKLRDSVGIIGAALLSRNR
jgi:glucokinase